jgi:hypothetical protein
MSECSKIVFETPRKSRDKIKYSQKQLNRIEKRKREIGGIIDKYKIIIE